jgi:hypothetical protein
LLKRELMLPAVVPRRCAISMAVRPFGEPRSSSMTDRRKSAAFIGASSRRAISLTCSARRQVWRAVNCGNRGAGRAIVAAKAAPPPVKESDEFVRWSDFSEMRCEPAGLVRAPQRTALACGNPEREQDHERAKNVTCIHPIAALPAGRFAIQDRLRPGEPIDCLGVFDRVP